MKHSLPVTGVVEAVVDGVRAGVRDFGIQANLIGIMSRTFGTDACQQELDAILSQKITLWQSISQVMNWGNPVTALSNILNKSEMQDCM